MQYSMSHKLVSSGVLRASVAKIFSLKLSLSKKNSFCLKESTENRYCRLHC